MVVRARLVLAVGGLFLALLVGLLAACSTDAKAAAPALKVSTTSAMVGERLTFSGAVTATPRPVVLQRYERGAWRTVASGRTGKGGSFSLQGEVRASASFRVVAPKAKVSGTTRGAVTTSTRKITVVAQSGTVRRLPGLRQAGGSVAAASSAYDLAVATFSPARPGRAVVFEQRSGSSWKVRSTTTQSSRGEAIGALTDGGTWRARTVGVGNVASKGTTTVPASSWKRTFVDEFDGRSLDTDTWAYRGLGSTSAKRACSTTREDMTKVSGGRLVVSTERDSTNDNGSGRSASCAKDKNGKYLFPYVNGHVGTQESFDFQYGIAAARVKMSSREGQHGAFWLQRDRTDRGAEIDVVEGFGDRADGGLSQYIHFGTEQPVGGKISREQAGLGSGQEFSEKYRVYSVEWTPKEYIFRIDGRETFRTSKHVSDVPQYLVLSMLTSDWEQARKADWCAYATERCSSSIGVDWVQVWQK